MPLSRGSLSTGQSGSPKAPCNHQENEGHSKKGQMTIFPDSLTISCSAPIKSLCVQRIIKVYFLGNPMDRGAWWAAVYGVTKSWTHTLFYKRVSKVRHFLKMICLRWFSFFMIVFIYFFLAVLCLCCFVRAFSSCSKQGLLFIVVQQLLIVVDFLCGVGFRRGASVVTVRELSFSLARGIFPDQGSNSSPLFWPVGSYPLCHQGSLMIRFLKEIFQTVAS